MGCGLRKLEDPDDSSPGKIFSTLKRPQVETKADCAYEYILLDFTLEGSSNPEVIKITSVLDIAKNVEEHYTKGYVVGAIHPVLLSIGRRKHFPASHMYRAVLFRPKLSQKHPASRGQRHPKLVIEECPLAHETLTNEVVKGLLDKVNDAAKRGMKFVGFLSQPCPQSKVCNGTNTDGNTESESTLSRRGREERRHNHNSEENVKAWNEGTFSGQSSESGIEEEIQPESGQSQDPDVQVGNEGSPSPIKLKKGGENKLYSVFNVFEDDSTSWTYHDGVLSLKVSKKGPVISTLDADWLELTTFYYKQGLSLIDSVVYWEASKENKLYSVFNVFEDDSTSWTYHDGVLSLKVSKKGPVISTLDADWLELTTFYYKQGLSLIDSVVYWEASKVEYLHKSLEGLFIYEEGGSGVPDSNRKGNDAIVVEQWTVIEGNEIKTDYGPLLHTLAEFGWLLTCVLPTPIIRMDSEGNLATKQVVFLQRPVMWNPALQTPEKKSTRQLREEKGKVSSRSVGSDTTTSHRVQSTHPSDEFHLSPSTQCWAKDESAQYGGFCGLSSGDGVLAELDDGQFDQEEGVTEVTCM